VVHATFIFIEPLFLSLDARPLSHSHCNRLSCPIIFSTSCRKNPKEKTLAMEKNEMPIIGASDVAASALATGASATAPVQAPIAALNVAAGTSVAGASAAGASVAAPVQAPVVASDVATGASAAAPVQAPVDWDLYEQEPYIAPENPYDTSIVDDKEVTLCSLVLIPFQSFLY
jgi:hypothetical protein